MHWTPSNKDVWWKKPTKPETTADMVTLPGSGYALVAALPAIPAPTPWGLISVRIEPSSDRAVVSWQGEWRQSDPVIEVRLSGQAPVISRASKGSLVVNSSQGGGSKDTWIVDEGGD